MSTILALLILKTKIHVVTYNLSKIEENDKRFTLQHYLKHFHEMCAVNSA